jgi:hypothetical protein
MTDPITDGTAWREFCERLAALGDRILEPDFPGSDRDRADGFHHLATQVVGWLGWAAGHRDAAYPTFFRQNDLVVRWGGPNVDQVTRRARIDPAGTYRISGTMGSCEDFILTLKNGDMHLERYGILAERMASELGIGAGDEFAILLAPAEATRDPASAPWVELHPETTMVNVREYYFDWAPRPPATIVIERLDTQGRSPAPLSPGDVARMLDEAAALVERSVVYWNDYVNAEQAKLPPNTMGAPQHSTGGSSRIHYSFGFFDLAPGETLVVDADPVDARFFDVQLYSLGWFESLDFANRVTSRNHTQVWRGDDGRVRVVITADDPGVANWLDTQGHQRGMVTFRWIRATEPPTITAGVVATDALGAALPPGTPTITREQRADEIRRRQAHAAWRYRT